LISSVTEFFQACCRTFPSKCEYGVCLS